MEVGTNRKPICDFLLVITAELGRALAVVKVTLQVNGNTQFSGVFAVFATGQAEITSSTFSRDGACTSHWPFCIQEDVGPGAEESLLGLLEDGCQTILWLL